MAVQTGSSTTFYPDIRLMEVTDPGHADTFNPLFKTLIDNDAFLKLMKADLSYVNTELAKKITPSEVDARIQALIDAAPAALDTLNELAAALNDDPNFATTMTNALATKVDKLTGKQLSTEDYTTTEKTKLAGIATGANNYVHPTTDGNLHVPATGITNNGKVLKAGATAGSISWGTLLPADVGALGETDTALAALKLATARTITLAGDATGTVTFDGSANVTITVTVADDSHNHIIANIDGLQAALDAKQVAIAYTPARMTSGTYTGDATANRAINLGFQPKYVKVIGNGVTFEAYPSLSQLTPQAQLMDGTNYTLNDAVNFGAITTTGFTLGSSTASKANATSQTYTYIAIA